MARTRARSSSDQSPDFMRKLSLCRRQMVPACPWRGAAASPTEARMKLYFPPGTCSLAPHIVLRELGLEAELVRLRLGTPPVIAATQDDYRTLNPNGYVPLLELDAGSLLTEGVAILQYLADLHPEAGLLPAATPLQRYESMRWLVYISSELHKMFSPWLFHP